jgi:hypothetical protein
VGETWFPPPKHRAGDAFVRLYRLTSAEAADPRESHQPRALRTRCKQQSRGGSDRRQALSERSMRNLRTFLFARGILRSILLALGRLEAKKGRTRGSGHKIRRAGNAFVHLPERLSASAYGPSGGFVLPAPRTRRRRDCRPFGTRIASPAAYEFRANCEGRICGVVEFAGCASVRP